MAKTIDILVPTYKRPDSLQRLADNIHANTKSSFMLWFGVEEDDKASFDAAIKTEANVAVNRYTPGYSNTIQTLYELSQGKFIIHANDDFDFHKDWDVEPLKLFKDPKIMVVGLKQTEGDVHGSAISIFRRKYIEEMSGVIDMPNRVFYPYHHNYVDTEFTETAQYRKVWVQCEPRVITHMHPGFTGLPADETYNKNAETSGLDRMTYISRCHLWQQP